MTSNVLKHPNYGHGNEIVRSEIFLSVEKILTPSLKETKLIFFFSTPFSDVSFAFSELKKKKELEVRRAKRREYQQKRRMMENQRKAAAKAAAENGGVAPPNPVPTTGLPGGVAGAAVAGQNAETQMAGVKVPGGPQKTVKRHSGSGGAQQGATVATTTTTVAGGGGVPPGAQVSVGPGVIGVGVGPAAGGVTGVQSVAGFSPGRATPVSMAGSAAPVGTVSPGPPKKKARKVGNLQFCSKFVPSSSFHLPLYQIKDNWQT